MGLLLLLTNTAAAVEVGVSPAAVTLNLYRGQEYQGQLLVLGSNREETGITGLVSDWSLTTKGSYQFLPAGTLQRSASPWVQFSPRSVKLPAKAAQKVTYTVRVPANATGSYWCALLFRALEPLPSPRTGGVQIRNAAQVAYVIRVNITGSPAGEGGLERLRLSWDPKRRQLEAVLRVKNSGSSFIRFKGRLELKDSQGRKVGVLLFKDGLVLPDYSREFALVSGTLDLAPGFYVGLAVADFGERRLKAIQTSLEIKK